MGWGKGNIFFGGAFRFAKYGLQFHQKKGSPSEGVAKRFRRLGIKTSKQNNFQFLLKEKGSREKIKN